MGFGAKIKQFAEEKYHKKHGAIADLARDLGITSQNLSRYVKETTTPGADFFVKMKNLGCDINWLLSDSEGYKGYVDISEEKIYSRIEEELINLFGSIEKAAFNMEMDSYKLMSNYLNPKNGFPPSTFLLLLASYNIDINYVLIGKRSKASENGQGQELTQNSTYNDIIQEIHKLEQDFGKVVQVQDIVKANLSSIRKNLEGMLGKASS